MPSMHYPSQSLYNQGSFFPQQGSSQSTNYHVHAHAHTHAHQPQQQPQHTGIPYENRQYPMFYPASYHNVPYIYGYQQPRTHHLADRHMLTDPKTESKPRLSKEEVEKLEKVFQENPKPSSATKGQLADTLGLDRPRINNWFQNRRAKAKQERKQEEYEARRAAEKASTEPVSPDDERSSTTSERTSDSARRRAQPSSARFPDVDLTSQNGTSFDNDNDNSEDEDESPESDESNSPQEAHNADGLPGPDNFVDFPEVTDFSNYQHMPQSYSHAGNVNGFTSYVSPQQSIEQLGHDEQSAMADHNLPSPEEQCGLGEYQDNRVSPVLDAGFQSAHITPYIPSQPSFTTPTTNMQMPGLSTPMSEGQTPIAMAHHGIPTPDSFKSPPPPANIASRRNIPRPATLQTASLRSRSYAYTGMSKNGMDGPKRMDPSSPITSMRRIVSSAGNIPGRIQKSSTGPRSPMVYNAEALLAYQSRSPMGPVAAAFSGAAPPTPMTPAVLDQQGMREPVVTSACSEDNAYLLGANLPTNMMEYKSESNLKTPPSTPGGLLNQFSNAYPNIPYTRPLDFQSDQPILTPFFNAEFPDMSMQAVPGYADVSDGSLPTTPLYPVNPMQEQNAFGHAMGNTQFDWDANEAVSSSRSSPNQSRSKQIQFTQNMTPQDYNSQQQQHA